MNTEDPKYQQKSKFMFSPELKALLNTLYLGVWIKKHQLEFQCVSCMTSVHQFIFTNPRIFSIEIWSYDSFNDAVKGILMPPQDLEKVGWFQSRKNNK